MNAEIREVLGKVVYQALADGGDCAEWERLEDEQEKEKCRLVADDVVRGLVALLAPVVQNFLPPEEIAELSKDTEHVRTDTPTRQGQLEQLVRDYRNLALQNPLATLPESVSYGAKKWYKSARELEQRAQALLGENV